MPNQFHFQVDLPVRILRADYQLPEVPAWTPTYSHVRADRSILSEEFKDFLEKYRLHPRVYAAPLLFYAHRDSRTSVHLDVGHPNIWAINCLLGPGQVDIKWHNPIGAGLHKDADLNYIRYDDQSPVVESVKCDEHRLVVSRIGVPHSSVNTGEGCWLLSLRLAPENLNWHLLKGRFI